MERSWIEKVDTEYFWEGLNLDPLYKEYLDHHTVTNQEDFQKKVLKDIEDFRLSNDRILFLGFGGLPGSGKTNNSLKIQKHIEEMESKKKKKRFPSFSRTD